MNIRSIKSALLTDLATITVANGYNATIKKVFKTFVPLSELKDYDSPSLGLYLGGIRTATDGEGNEFNILTYGLGVYVSISEDVDKNAVGELTVTDIYEDVLSLFSSAGADIYGVDGVQDVSVISLETDVFIQKKGLALITIQIETY